MPGAVGPLGILPAIANVFGIGVRVRQRLDQKRAQRAGRLAHDQAVAAQVRSIADVVLRIGDRFVENEKRRGPYRLLGEVCARPPIQPSGHA